MAKQIPLRNRSGEIVAHALVDDGDFDQLAPFRWHLLPGGYARRTARVADRPPPYGILMHRVVLGLDSDDSRQADHINGDKLDNRRANLRPITAAQNKQNRRKIAPARSIHRGVVFHPFSGLWQARIKVNGRFHSGGYFKDPDDAGRAAAALRAQLMPFSIEAVKEVA